MTKEPQHHISNELLAEYYRGTLDQSMSVFVACHCSICDTCRAKLEAFDAIGGALLSDELERPYHPELEELIISKLDAAPAQSVSQSIGCYPAPLVEMLGNKPPKWRNIGMGVKQKIIAKDRKSSIRLLQINGGLPVPEHSHCGDEYTLVLQGAFHDITGTYRKGDVQVADHTLEHQPISLEGEPCICLAVTSDKLNFKSFLPRVFQPLFSI